MPSRRSKSPAVETPSNESRFSSPKSGSRIFDAKTKQPLYYECHICILGRVSLHRDEQYSQVKAEVLMKRLYRKRQSHCVAYFLENSVRFRKTKLLGTQPFRNFVTFNAIKHVFLFEDKPDAIMLCIDSGRSDKRTYEAYKCKRQEDVLNICELIYKASLDPDYKLRDLAPIKEFSRLSELSIPLQCHSSTELDRSDRGAQSTTSLLDVFTFQRVSDPMVNEYPPRRYDSSPLELHRVAMVKSAPKNDQRAREITVRTPSGSAQNSWKWIEPINPMNDLNELFKKKDDDEWEVSVTYLTWNSRYGAVETDCGPIYMYMARRLRPVA